MNPSVASPSPLRLIASLDAVGGAVPVWARLVWLVRLLLGLPAPGGRHNAPWRIIRTMLEQIGASDVPLTGIEVAEWTVQRGLWRMDCTRIRVVGELSPAGGSQDYTLIIEYVVDEPEEYGAWRSNPPPASAAPAFTFT